MGRDSKAEHEYKYKHKIWNDKSNSYYAGQTEKLYREQVAIDLHDSRQLPSTIFHNMRYSNDLLFSIRHPEFKFHAKARPNS